MRLYHLFSLRYEDSPYVSAACVNQVLQKALPKAVNTRTAVPYSRCSHVSNAKPALQGLFRPHCTSVTDPA